MKILFTGGSSFTGCWIIKELASAGHDIVAVFRREVDEYPDELRRTRIGTLAGICRPVFGVSFGDDRFLALIKEGNWDLHCHHGADVTNYKSPDFDIAAAVANNTHRLAAVLDALLNKGCAKIIVTGSVFEKDEGAGSDGLRALSPYGLSKAFTWQVFRYHAQLRQMMLGKFVIPNPFGPFEDPRFVHYLMKCWFIGETAVVNTPSYVRDNIHVSLLSKCYADLVKTMSDGITRLNPSGYVESQGAFTRRVASAMRNRLDLKCDFELKTQKEFPEPHIRINTDSFAIKLGWNEAAAWDELAAYYSQLMTKR